MITTYEQSGGTVVIMEHQKPQQRQKFGALLNSDHSNDTDQEDVAPPNDRPWSPMPSNDAVSSPYATSPWSQASPFAQSPWITASPAAMFSPYGGESFPRNGLVGSLHRKEGHVYSLAVSGDLLYTGSDSKNIRVWKSLKDFTGFKCSSGLVKAIVIAAGDRIFTGHQDGKIRVWRVSRSNPKNHRRVGTLPSFKDSLVSSVNPKNYVEVRRKRNVLRIRHFDAVSSMSLDEEQGILYSASWDKTVKVWRIATSKCLESFVAHDDAVNAVVASGIDGLVFTGSADGTVKAWRRRISNRDGTTEHFLVQTPLRQENAVTALAASKVNSVVYAGSSDGLVNFWELRGKRLSHGGVLRGHKLAVLCLAAAGNLVFSGSADRNICVWRRDQASGLHAVLSVLTGHSGPVKCLAVAEDRSDEHSGGDDGDEDDHDRRWVVYSGSLDKSVKVWRVSENAPELKQLRAWELQCASNIYAPSPKVSYAVGRLSHKNLLGQY